MTVLKLTVNVNNFLELNFFFKQMKNINKKKINILIYICYFFF
jgi:hypothetical protein